MDFLIGHKRLTRFVVWILALGMACVSQGFVRAQSQSPIQHPALDGNDVQSLIDGLSDSTFRVRRESFLKLCDRSFKIDDWLAKETRSEDRYRASVAQWLMRLRQSSGSTVERLESLQDLESLKKMDDRVLKRHVSQGKWDQLVELIALLDAPTKRELLGEEDRLEWLIQQAWRSKNESYVPRLLNLVLSPTDRVHANRWWRQLGMPPQWRVDVPNNMPSSQIIQLEDEGKIEEAIELAKRKGASNFVEGLWLRSNRWDDWLALDPRRTIISGSSNWYQQRVSLLLTLGRLQEANELLETAMRPKGDPAIALGDGLLSLLADRMDDFETFLESQPVPKAFTIRRARGDVSQAFELVGLQELSVQSVKKWLHAKAFEDIDLSEDEEETVESLLIDIADLFFQIGFFEQGQLIDDYVVEETKKLELSKGVEAWVPLLREWRIKNDRPKAIKYWIEYLIREKKRRARSNFWTHRNSIDESGSQFEENNPFAVFYPEFSQSAPEIMEFLCNLEMSKLQGINKSMSLDIAEVADQVIPKAIAQLEDLAFGRLPKDWKSEKRAEAIRKHVFASSTAGGASTYTLGLELAALFDSLGDPNAAYETLEQLPSDQNVNLARAKYLRKLGEYDAASNLLIELFAEHSTDLTLMIECTDCLEISGRFDEMDRVRIQGLSSVSNIRVDITEGSLFSAPPRREVQMILEQHWRRNNDLYSALCLTQQFTEAAKQDLSQSTTAARIARLAMLERVKNIWPNKKLEYMRRLILFMHGYSAYILEAITKRDIQTADTLIRMAHRCSPHDIDLAIAIVPIAERELGKEIADTWFQLYFQPMLAHANAFPRDTLIGNNTAWLAASCGRELETAHRLATAVVASDSNPTYVDTLAEIEFRLGNIDKAIELSERCRSQEPKEKHHREQLKRFRSAVPLSANPAKSDIVTK